MGSDFDLFERLVEADSNFSSQSSDFDIIISTSLSSSKSICLGTRYPFSDPDMVPFSFPMEVSSTFCLAFSLFREFKGDLLSFESDDLGLFLMVSDAPLNFLSRIRTLRSASSMTAPTGAEE